MYDDEDDYDDELPTQFMMGSADVLTHEDRLGTRAQQITQVVAVRSELKTDDAGDAALLTVINLLIDDMKAVSSTAHAPLTRALGFTAKH